MVENQAQQRYQVPVKQPVFSWRQRVIAIVGVAAWAMNAGWAQPSPPAPAKPSPSSSVTSSPSTPPKPGKRVEEIFKLLETRDYTTISALVKTSFSPDFVALQGESNLNGYLADYAHRTGGIRRGKIREDGTDAIGFFQSTVTERWGAITLSVEPAPPNRISSLQIQRANPPKSAAPAAPPTDDKARFEKISNYAEKLAKAELFSGVIAIAQNDRPIFTKAYGMADRNSGVANTPETRFQVGEIDKSFTAVAIAQLVEAKKLSYDNPLSMFVEYPGRMSAGKITIKHLLSHTSGLGDYLSDKYTANVRRLTDIKSYLSILNYRPLGFEPGTSFQDSRVGYLMLGRIIEIASGEDYYEYIQRHIFKPAGMENSFQDFLEKPNPKSAIRYEDYFEKDHFVTDAYANRTPLPARGAPDNATFSTAEDIVRFVGALRNGKLVSPATYQLMTTAKPELRAKTYGYGFMVNKSIEEGRDIIGHDGDGPGLCAEYDLIRDLKEPYTVVILSNTSAMGHSIAETIISLYPREPTQQ
jgi:CubicO group peptidase (beta-lactamase class C family)